MVRERDLPMNIFERRKVRNRSSADPGAPDGPDGSHAIADTPRFIALDVWKRAHYYSCSRKTLEYLERSLDRHATLEDIAASVCMDRTAFSRAFKRNTGMTVHAFVQAYRVSKAVARLEVSDCSITEIAFDVGFNSLGTFERAFKKVAGTTPTRHRSELRQRNGLVMVPMYAGAK